MNLARLYRTLLHIRFRQIVARLWFRLRRVSVGQIDQPELALVKSAWSKSVRKNVDILGEFRFRLLNKIMEVRDPQDWNDPRQDKLLLYHLHYHDVLNATESDLVSFDGAALIDRWIADNPPVVGNGWEPYPLSLRIVNWIKWHLEGNNLGAPALASLFLQARALSQQIEYHLMANHIFANAKALYFAGVFFDGAEPAKWRRAAIDILRVELPEQILADGGHFELSPMYQSIISEDVLDILNIGRAFGVVSFGDLSGVAKRMIDWLSVMSHGDGLPSYFNDATAGVAPPLQDISAYGKRLGISNDDSIPDGIHQLSESGYVRYQDGPVAVIVDVGQIGPDYQPGHAHCDCLSFELSIGANRLLVNSGISTYNANMRRLLERQTAAHNTVSIVGHEQSEVWSAFRVGRRARPAWVEVGNAFISAEHDGYRPAGITHRRRLSFDAGQVVIVDKLEAHESARGIAHFHFHPDAIPAINGQVVRLDKVTMTFDGAASVELQDYEYSQGFNKLASAKKVAVSFAAKLTTSIQYEDPVCF